MSTSLNLEGGDFLRRLARRGLTLDYSSNISYVYYYPIVVIKGQVL